MLLRNMLGAYMRFVKCGVVTILCAGLAVLTGAMSANATPIEYDFTVDNCSSGCGGGTGPGGAYGKVEVSDLTALPFSGIHVDVSLYAPSKFVNTGAGYSLMFSLAGNPAISIDNLTTGWLRVTSPAGPYSAGGDFGQFYYAIQCTACGSGGSNPQPGPFSFDIFSNIDLSVGDFIDGLKITGPKANPTITPTGIFFVTDLIGQNGLTGRIGAPAGFEQECVNPDLCGDPDPLPLDVPEPPALSMFLFGVAAVVRLRRANRNQRLFAG